LLLSLLSLLSLVPTLNARLTALKSDYRCRDSLVQTQPRFNGHVPSFAAVCRSTLLRCDWSQTFAGTILGVLVNQGPEGEVARVERKASILDGGSDPFMSLMAVPFSRVGPWGGEGRGNDLPRRCWAPALFDQGIGRLYRVSLMASQPLWSCLVCS